MEEDFLDRQIYGLYTSPTSQEEAMLVASSGVES
jgi:hypothetical protein